MTALRRPEPDQTTRDPSDVDAGNLRRLRIASSASTTPVRDPSALLRVDAVTCAAYRVDAVDLAQVDALRAAGRQRVLPITTDVGCLLPTFLPPDMQTTVGVIRVTPVQSRAAFLTAPVGVACPPTIIPDQPIRLVAGVLPGLALHAAGVANVWLAVDPVVVSGLLPVLRDARVEVVATRRAAAAAIIARLGSAARHARSLLIAPDPLASRPEVLAQLGLGGGAPSAVLTEPSALHLPPSLACLRTFHTYTRGCITNGHAQDALVAAGCDIPALLDGYQIGWCPPDARDALPSSVQAWFDAHALGGALIVPAWDDQGLIVDGWVRTPDGQERNLSDPPQGMCAPAVSRDAEDLLVVDRLDAVAAAFRAGHRAVQLLRGPADAAHVLPRLRAQGVRRVTLQVADAEIIATACRAAGLAITASASVSVSSSASTSATSPPAITCVDADQTTRRVTYAAGAVRYIVEERSDGDTRRHCTIRAHGQSAADHCNLAVDAQRLRFAHNAALRLGVPAERIAADLAAVLQAVLAREEALASPPAVPVSPEDRRAVEHLLDGPDPLAVLAADLDHLGWVGDTQAKALLLLTTISRLLPRPLMVAYRGSPGSRPWLPVACMAATIPTEDAWLVRRPLDLQALGGDRRGQRRQVAIIERADLLRPEDALTLQVAQERAGMSWAGGGSGAGAVAVIAAATGDLDPRWRAGVLIIPADESPAQTQRIQVAACRRCTADAHHVPAIIARHHALHRCIAPAQVEVPFADRIIFPAHHLRHRVEFGWLLTLIQAHALLRQRQCHRSDHAVVATPDDLTAVVTLTRGLLGVDGGLSSAAERLLAVFHRRGAATSTMADLRDHLPDWTRYAVLSALTDLQDHGLITIAAAGRGRPQTYHLQADADPAAGDRGIRLRPIEAHIPTAEPVEPAGLSAVVGNESDNFIPYRTGT